MHAAPSVTYPVGRSAFAGALCVALAALGLAAAGAWTWQSDAFGWRQGLAFAAVLACALPGLLAWLHAPVGALRWDGLGWQWQQGAASEPGQAELALDLQARLLVRWRAEGGRTRWLWIEQESALADWDALRRAVYSRANAPVPTFPRKGKEGVSAGKPPAAEQ
jgi:toxin CptA